MSSIKVKISAYFVVIAVSLLLLEVTSLPVYAVKHIVIRDSDVSEFRSIMSNHYSILDKELGKIGSLGCKIAYPDGKETSITLNLQN